MNLDGSASGGGAVTAPPGASAPLNLDLHGMGMGMGPTNTLTRRGLLPALPPPPDDKLSKDIDKASRIDCKDAYAGAGLLAVIPLAKDAATGKGCKW